MYLLNHHLNMVQLYLAIRAVDSTNYKTVKHIYKSQKHYASNIIILNISLERTLNNIKQQYCSDSRTQHCLYYKVYIYILQYLQKQNH